MWYEKYFDGAMNYYRDIDQYMTIREKLDVSDRFFLGINKNGATPRDFFVVNQLIVILFATFAEPYM